VCATGYGEITVFLAYKMPLVVVRSISINKWAHGYTWEWHVPVAAAAAAAAVSLISFY